MFDFDFLNSSNEGIKLARGFASLSCTCICASVLLVSFNGLAGARQQDLSGGASAAPKRSPDNTSRRRPKSTKKITKTTTGGSAPSQARVDLTKKVDAALELGNAARDSNPSRYPDAESAYKLAMGLDPTDARPYVGLGNTYFDQKRYPEAETLFRRAIDLDPQDADALVALAFANNAAEHFEEAERSAQRALVLDANNYAAFVALGWSKYRRKNYPEAEVAYRRAIALSPKTLELYGELGQVLMDQGHWREAEPVLLQAVTLDPSNAATLSDYAMVLHKLGQLDKAASAYAQAMTLDPKMISPHSNLALIQYTRGDFAKAREEWDSAIRLSSTYALDRAGLLVLDRKLAEAQVQLETYILANAADEDGWLLLGDVRRMQSDSAGASAAYAHAAQIAPDYAQHARPTLPEPPVAKIPAHSDAKSDKESATTSAGKTAVPTAGSPSQQSVSAAEPKLRYASSLRTVKATNNARPTPASGAISVACNPNAVVLIEPVGGGEAQMSVVPTSITVVAFNQLRPGEYLVSASLDGYVTVETKVFVAATKIISVKLTLRPKT